MSFLAASSSSSSSLESLDEEEEDELEAFFLLVDFLLVAFDFLASTSDDLLPLSSP
jgi:hypothetical protein